MLRSEGGLGVAHGAQHPAPVGVGAEHGRLHQGGGHHRLGQTLGALLAPGARHFAGDQLAGPLAVSGDGPGQMAADVVQRCLKGLVALVLPLNQLVARHAVGQHYAGVVGGGVPVHGDPVEGFAGHLPQGILQHLVGDGAVGGDKAQHGAHVGVDHAGALGDGSDFDLFPSQAEGDGDLLFHRVGGHDGPGGPIGAVGGQGRGHSGHARLNGLDVDSLADDPGGADRKVPGLPAGGGGGGGAHGLRVLVAAGTAGIGVAAVGYDAPGGAVLQVVHGHVDGGGLYPVQCIHPGGGTLPVREDHGQVVLVRTAACAAGDAARLEALGGAHAAGDFVEHRCLSFTAARPQILRSG